MATTESVKNFTKMNDRELVTLIKTTKNKEVFNRAFNAIFARYERQVHKNWFKLRAQMNNSDLVNSMEDEFYSEAREAFYTAIQKVDLDKIKNDKWKLVGMSNWYLTNVRTKMINEILKMSKVKGLTHMHDVAEDESSAIDPDVEIAYWEQEGYKDDPLYACEAQDREDRCLNAIENCKRNKWSDIELKIFEGLLKRQKKAEIAASIGCNVAKVYSLSNKMRDDIMVALN